MLPTKWLASALSTIKYSLFGELRGAIQFFWLCMQHASKSTFEKSNVWLWAGGLPVTGAIVWYWKRGLVRIPDDILHSGFFFVETLIFFWIVFFFYHLIGAPGRVWSREVREKERLAQILDDRSKRIAIKSLLGEALISGQTLLHRCHQESPISQSLEEEVQKWGESTKDFIASVFGSGEAALFLNSSDFVFPVSTDQGMQNRIWIDGRLRRLSELIRRAHTIPMDEWFNPEDHKKNMRRSAYHDQHILAAIPSSAGPRQANQHEHEQGE
jgi:hypothetical protein